LVISDVAARQWSDPFGEEEIQPYLTSAITDDSSPLRGTKVAIFRGCCLRSGFALPEAAASENFLILFVGDSYPDCRGRRSTIATSGKAMVDARGRLCALFFLPSCDVAAAQMFRPK